MISLEAKEGTALGVLAAEAEDEQCRLAGVPAPPRWRPDVGALAADAARVRATDPALAALFAEAYATSATRRAREGYRAARARHPVALRGEGSVPFDALASVVATEAAAGRRHALVEAADAAAADTLADARAAVDALRDAADALGPEGAAGLGLADDVFALAIDATDDAFRDLDARVCATYGLDRARMTWPDRLRSVACMAVTSEVSPATWRDLAARWLDRVGLGHALRGVASELAPASRAGTGVRALGLVPGARAVVAGRPTVAGSGALDVAGAVAHAAAFVLARGERGSERLGADRAGFSLASALGRRLYLHRPFVHREAGLGAAARERAMIEALHAELVALRLDAALARFTRDALARERDLAARFEDYTARAVGVGPSPAWGAHVVASALDARYGARALGALAEPALHAWLRGNFDEDWFRNPRAGVAFALALGEARAKGVRAWVESVGAKLDADTVARRWLEVVEDARRAVP